MMAIRSFLIILTFVFSVYAEDSGRISLPRSMAVLGDSISEGMLSEYSVEEPPTIWQMFSMVSIAKQFTGIQRLSIFRERYAKRQHSWATGDDDSDIVQSHLERLRFLVPDMQGHNFAVSGSRTQDLFAQVDNVLSLEKTQGILVDYIPVFLGANDLWGETLDELLPPLSFEENIRSAMKRLLDVNPHRMILLVGLPHIDKVFESSESLVAYQALGSRVSCKEMRQNIYGKAIIFDSKNAQYDNAKVFMQMYRNALMQASKSLQDEFPMAQIKAIHDYEIPSLAYKSLSTDCFHPSLWGQALLAETTWSAGFWPELVTPDELMNQ